MYSLRKRNLQRWRKVDVFHVLPRILFKRSCGCVHKMSDWAILRHGGCLRVSALPFGPLHGQDRAGPLQRVPGCELCGSRRGCGMHCVPAAHKQREPRRVRLV
eukprot:Rmarinus@m.21284